MESVSRSLAIRIKLSIGETECTLMPGLSYNFFLLFNFFICIFGKENKYNADPLSYRFSKLILIGWRICMNCSEKDLDEVLQTMAVFSNVSKGILAKREDLLLAFGTDDEKAICLKILAEGEFQVSDKERKVELNTMFRDVASVLSEKCVNSETNRPYTISVLERALKDVHFSVDPRRPAKSQALEALPILKKRFPIERAKMRLRILIPLHGKDELYELLSKNEATIENQDLKDSNMLYQTCLIDPGAFRKVHNVVQSIGGGGRVEVIALAASGDNVDAPAGLESLSLNKGPERSTKGEHMAESNKSSDKTTDASHVDTKVIGRSGFVAAPSANSLGQNTAVRRSAPELKESDTDTIVYSRGRISDLPEDYASRKERFQELDNLQTGWTVELRRRHDNAPIDAIFYSPSGSKIGAFAMARRLALAHSKNEST